MNESEFNQSVDDTLLAIEEVLDEVEADIDYENSGGVLSVTCPDGSKVIFTRQAPVRQLWVATRSGGYHFDYAPDLDTWVLDSDATPLAAFLATTFATQAGESISFEL